LIDTGHTTNILCTKFISKTSNELVAFGAGDATILVGNIVCISAYETTILTMTLPST